MDVFSLRDGLTDEYASYASSFIQIQDSRIQELIQQHYTKGTFWPDPLIQINPTFRPGGSISDLVASGRLHPECRRIFRRGKAEGNSTDIQLHQHQVDAIEVAHAQRNYILSTGTGSGKSLAYIIPIVDYVLRHRSGQGIKAIIVYPMNALANSQEGELRKFLKDGYDNGDGPVTFARYTGQESDEARQAVIENPPDILLTNYVMLELLMTRPKERRLISQAKGLRFLVLDELHTYRGRQGADVAMLVRRVRERVEDTQPLICIGTSATLATEGTWEQQKQTIAAVGSQLFGVPHEQIDVIGETLTRSTPEFDANDPGAVHALCEVVKLADRVDVPSEYASFAKHIFSSWIEGTFGVQQDGSRIVRSSPRSITGEEGAANELARLTGSDPKHCAALIKTWLLAGYACEPHPVTGFRPFAFKLHQFISPGDAVYATIERPTERHITLDGQRFAPGGRDRLLFPMCFCRECGQEYYIVRRAQHSLEPRDFRDQSDDKDGDAGYLYISATEPWSEDNSDIIDRIPEDWIEAPKGVHRVKRYHRDKLPQSLFVTPDGQVNDSGINAAFVPTPFAFCLNCGVSYSPRQGDFGKLATLSSEGRSSATTLISLSAITKLRTSDLAPHARKLLSFTDNRQDASLQAGHFNDFVEVGLLRAAILRAAEAAGPGGLRHETITQQVFDALNLPVELYAANPEARFEPLKNTKRALREVLGYRIYRDLRRGWRITSPNLEQCDLLKIDYSSLDELCADESIWNQCHQSLSTALPATREEVAKILLDYMRRELAIKVNYLESGHQEVIKQLSNQWLSAPWAIDEDETLEYARVLYPRSAAISDNQGSSFLSARSGFGTLLRRPTTFKNQSGPKNLDETAEVIRQLLDCLVKAGIVEQVEPPRTPADTPGYQVVASAMSWHAGKGTRAFRDPIRIPRASNVEGRPNPFFVKFYREASQTLIGLEAKEHTAQVPYREREDRETAFRTARLPVLYCSPTMELGVDIAELNVVNLRNVPPTPANYAQRSGRAGRSGQPALVVTYCSSGSPHDRYFFKRPESMVAGAVAPARLDLTNADLLQSHIHAVWLAETSLDLGDTPKDVLDVQGDSNGLALLTEVKEQLDAVTPRERARVKSKRILDSVAGLSGVDELIEVTLNSIGASFDRANDRWRSLFIAAQRQAVVQADIARDVSRSSDDRKRAETLRRQAINQLDLLTKADNLAQSDFYSYRYFATEGFLPGYSFPRLPVSAYIPARRSRQKDEFLSRPRFLAVSEFGPRAIIYHEGSRYVINRVLLTPSPDPQDDALTTQMKQCSNCGYIHPLGGGRTVDLCENCQTPLGAMLDNMMRMQNVETRRRDRINSDEEERMRMGYELKTGVRFAERGGVRDVQTAEVYSGDEQVARLTYAQSATLWRINLGWSRRKDKSRPGFVLDLERGYWARNEQLEEDAADPISARTRRVVPFVEDSKNALIFEPHQQLDARQMASLESALKRAIEAAFQLEDSELAVEPLPDERERRSLLLYESAEGGAGVLRRLVEDPAALATVAREALELCHFDPDTGEDMRHAPNATENCEAACYNCLLTYSNQREHALMDRQAIKAFLLELAEASVRTSPTAATRDDHLGMLLRVAESELEREWLRYLEEHGLRLPDEAQTYFEQCQTRADFYYKSGYAVYIDGDPHNNQRQQKIDSRQTACLEDEGIIVLRFGYRRETWDDILRGHKNVFGESNGI